MKIQSETSEIRWQKYSTNDISRIPQPQAQKPQKSFEKNTQAALAINLTAKKILKRDSRSSETQAQCIKRTTNEEYNACSSEKRIIISH